MSKEMTNGVGYYSLLMTFFLLIVNHFSPECKGDDDGELIIGMCGLTTAISIVMGIFIKIKKLIRKK